MFIVLHKVFEAVVNEILRYLPILGESGLEVSYFTPDTRNVSEVTRLSDNIKKPWLKSTLTYIKNIIKNQNFLVQDPEKGEPVTPCMKFIKLKSSMMGVYICSS